MLEKRITTLVKDLLSGYINEGDFVVDLTAGNGNDTLFLAEKVGKNGQVYAFDLQSEALQNTKNLLQEKNLLNQVTLIHDGHETIDRYVHKKIKVAMFNLGYLPGGDHRFFTKPETTCCALQKTIQLLDASGVVSIISYYGHEGGSDEKDALERFLSSLDEKTFHVMTISYPNRKQSPPLIHFILKKG